METGVQIRLPETDLKSAQHIANIELKDAAGQHVGQYFFGKGYGRTVFLFGKYRERSRLTQSARPSSTAFLQCSFHENRLN